MEIVTLYEEENGCKHDSSIEDSVPVVQIKMKKSLRLNGVDIKGVTEKRQNRGLEATVSIRIRENKGYPILKVFQQKISCEKRDTCIYKPGKDKILCREIYYNELKY